MTADQALVAALIARRLDADEPADYPEFGTRADVKALAKNVHARGMKLVLDGVFNHMGRNAPKFQEAFKNPQSPWRNWFAIGPQYEGGARRDSVREK